MNQSEETTIISLGGSLIVPDDIDIEFVKSFTELIKNRAESGERFVIITGGGRICRRYQAALKAIRPTITSEEGDWMGIYVTRLNGELVRLAFGQSAYSKVVFGNQMIKGIPNSIIVGAGDAPGRSTDFDAVELAEAASASRIINLSNIDFVYSADPKIDPNAKKYQKISWSEYRSIIPKDWKPGLSTPFDPVASEKAEQLGLKVLIANGKSLDNLKALLLGQPFEGTTIS